MFYIIIVERHLEEPGWMICVLEIRGAADMGAPSDDMQLMGGPIGVVLVTV
jgi:hypothetical protein